MESKGRDSNIIIEKKDGPKIILTEAQQKIITAIEINNVEDLTNVFKDEKVDVNFVDDNKMTPLQHACYRGNTENVKLLLDHGADVNKCEHEYDYTTLHFAALSGNVDICHLLLAAGCKTHALNSVNRTASQMASFVGNHNVVCTINNFIPKSDIDYYTQPQGQQKEAVLPQEIAESLYKFALLYNLHPVKIAMLLQSYEGLSENLDSIKKVFDLMSEREMKRKSTNEVLSFKFYYISYIIGEIAKVIKVRKEQNTTDLVFVLNYCFELFSKKLLKANKDGNLDFMEAFLRESVREFPYIESTLFRQMVASLASENAPPALSVVSAAVNGQRAFMDDTIKCNTCGEEKPTKKCAKCKNVSYCDRECQRLHWFMHKKDCAKLRQTVDAPRNIDLKEVNAEIQGLLAGN